MSGTISRLRWWATASSASSTARNTWTPRTTPSRKPAKSACGRRRTLSRISINSLPRKRRSESGVPFARVQDDQPASGPTGSIHQPHQLWEAFMTTRKALSIVASVAVALALMIPAGAGLLLGTQQQSRLDADRIGQAAGTKATTTPDGIVRIGW